MWISDVSGANQVVLELDQLPDPHPRPVRKRRVQTHTMRPGATAAGLRVVSDQGTHLSYSDLRFRSEYVSPANLAALEAKYDAYPPVPVLVSLDNGVTILKCAWGEDGLVPTNWSADHERHTVEFFLHVLGTFSFGS